jgi:hypothetical protein
MGLAQDKGDTLSEPVFRRLLNQQFTNLITGQSKNSIGNFASLDVKEGEFSFSGSSIFPNYSALTVKASGAITDGLASIFSNSRLNTKFTFDVQFNVLSPTAKHITYDETLGKAFRLKERQIESAFRLDTASITLHHQESSLRKKKAALEILSSSLKERMDSSKDKETQDSLGYELTKVVIQTDSIGKALEEASDTIGLKIDALNRRNHELNGISIKRELDGFGMGWFSIGYKVAGSSFKLFYSSAPFDSQVVSTSFLSHEARIQYSYYKWSASSFESYFWCGGIAISYGDNFSELTKREVADVKNYGPSLNDRTITKKYNVYTGIYKTGIKTLRPYGDVFLFLFKGNCAAVHAYPEVQFTSEEKPLWSMGIGFLVSFRDSKDESAVVNAELYYTEEDLFNSRETTYKLFERNDIGIRFSVPIKFTSK